MIAKTVRQQELALIKLSEEELASGQITSHHLQAALEALHRDGICVLKNAVDPSHLDQLNSRMVHDAKILLQKQETHHNFGAGRSTSDFLFRLLCKLRNCLNRS